MQTERKLPLFAGRSKKGFGLNLVMEPAFFHETSSEGEFNRTRHPVPSAFRKYEQEMWALRIKLFKSPALSEFTQNERKNEWLNVMSENKSFATSFFLQLSGFKGQTVPHIETMIDSMNSTALEAIIHLRGMISRRIDSNGATICKPTPKLSLMEKRSPLVYVVRDYCRDGKHHCKIGFTEDLEQRLRQFKTSNPAIELLATLHCSDIITEPAVHGLFDSKWQELEWFLLDDSDLVILKNPERIRQMILEAA